jgi:hypothetical protein
VVKVNASDEQPNTAFFAQFPVMERDYPHLLVLDADGGLLVSQATGELRKGEAFQPARVSAFKQWALTNRIGSGRWPAGVGRRR